ncbi:MAG: HsdM family class I SAM-dependent methyltransferase [Bacteroidota bacterium]
MTSFTKEYIKGLSHLEMVDSTYSTGLAHVSELENAQSKINYYQRVALEKAKRINVNAVYFRNYPESNRASIPQLYIFDFTQQKRNIVDIHKKVWSSSEVRLYLIITKTEIKLFNSSKPVKFNSSNELYVSPFEILKLAGEATELYEKFSSKKFDNGSFWDEIDEDFSYKDTAYEKLITELKNARDHFLQKIHLNKNTSSKLLVQGILVKYLEERVDIDKDGNESRVFSKDFFNRKEFGFSNTFIEVISSGYLLDLFDYLSQHFNGKIFSLSADQKKRIKAADLSPLADFLSGEIDNKHYVLWRLYSFNHLPIELISSIYEVFLEAEKNSGIAYTPSYLVNFMIDECMPLDKPKQEYKIIDPACGSGIFLVAGYKRLIDWWRIKHFEKTGDWIFPGKEHLGQLKKFLKNNIFGLDIEEEAVDLTIFSLSLTLCDVLSPKVIWENLKFDDLSSNIVSADFFEWIKEDKKEFYDLVIGNPPFIEYGSKNPTINDMVTELGIKNKVPNNQSALLFTLMGIKLAKKDSGLLSFVLPSGPLLYNNSDKPVEFRKWLFSSYNIPQIVDFTYLSNVLFKNKGNEKNVAVSAFFLENKLPDDQPIYHITVKKLKSAKERQYFEIDHYDFYKVNKDRVLNDVFLWKSNLLGGGRLVPLINKLSKFSTLKDLIESRKTLGWVCGDGIIEGKKDDNEVTFEDLLKKRYKSASFITGKKIFNPDDFDENGIHQTYICERKYFQRSRNTKKNIFKSPHLLLKKNIGEDSIPCVFLNEDIIFKNEIIGIHCPKEDEFELESIYYRIKNNPLYRAYILATSGRAGISRSPYTYTQQDILRLPYPKDESEIRPSKYESILIEDTLNFGLEFLGKDTDTLKKVTNTNIHSYGNVFCEILNSIFEEKGRKYYQNKIVETASFICVSFHYGSKSESSLQNLSDEEFETKISGLVHKEMGTSYRIKRIIKLYDGDYIYFLKPKNLRYWLRSIAIRDADEAIVDLYNAGY